MSAVPLRLRPLRLADLPALMAIEFEVFSMPWPESVYRYEIMGESGGFYYALELVDGDGDGSAEQAVEFVGYAGFWIMGDEGHLMTIAVAPHRQGQGLGEWLLLAILDAMEAEGAEVATLEVRESNLSARALYRQLGFQVVGRRRRYYSDSGEDALIMTTPGLESLAMRDLRRERREAVEARLEREGPDLLQG